MFALCSQCVSRPHVATLQLLAKIAYQRNTDRELSLKCSMGEMDLGLGTCHICRNTSVGWRSDRSSHSSTGVRRVGAELVDTEVDPPWPRGMQDSLIAHHSPVQLRVSESASANGDGLIGYLAMVPRDQKRPSGMATILILPQKFTPPQSIRTAMADAVGSNRGGALLNLSEVELR
jgi:hypothetical protein